MAGIFKGSRSNNPQLESEVLSRRKPDWYIARPAGEILLVALHRALQSGVAKCV